MSSTFEEIVEPLNYEAAVLARSPSMVDSPLGAVAVALEQQVTVARHEASPDVRLLGKQIEAVHSLYARFQAFREQGYSVRASRRMARSDELRNLDDNSGYAKDTYAGVRSFIKEAAGHLA